MRNIRSLHPVRVFAKGPYMHKTALSILSIGLSVGLAVSSLHAAPKIGASATIINAKGKSIGTATLTETVDGIILQINAKGLKKGDHGLHIHRTGKCELPKFDSAGPHFDLGGHQHGRDNPKGAHTGDLPNITPGKRKMATAEAVIPGIALFGANGLLDSDGAAIVIHAGPDDYKTDPSGNSGARVACGVFNKV
jgi:superoxide dismutase, Cu-Zn family